MSTKNFTATRDGVAINVTAVSAATQLNADINVAASAPDVLIDNRGNADCYIKFGAADVTTTAALGLRVPSGSIAIYGKANATHMAVIGASATQLVVHLGEGV